MKKKECKHSFLTEVIHIDMDGVRHVTSYICIGCEAEILNTKYYQRTKSKGVETKCQLE